jgi:imidazolonepropionase-like amidohydrolase
VAITNARVIVGNGTVINSGTVIVRGGKIASVSAGAANTQGLTTIDARGMSAMPGLIDAHRHVNTGPNEKTQMQALLEAGYTTILSGGGPAEGNLTLRDHIEKGLINGPRVIPSGTLRLRNNTPEMARAEIRRMAEMGIRFTGEIGLTPVPGPSVGGSHHCRRADGMDLNHHPDSLRLVHDGPEDFQFLLARVSGCWSTSRTKTG